MSRRGSTDAASPPPSSTRYEVLPRASSGSAWTAPAEVVVKGTPPERSLRLAGEEGVTEHLVGPGLLLTLGAAERVDGLADAHVHEADLLEHRLPACARQATGNSAGPQVDVAQRLWRYRLAV